VNLKEANMPEPVDPVELTAELIRCPSVTPAEAGALELLQDRLSAAGFECHRIDRGGVANLFARCGDRGHPRTFGFNGHTDVVPAGDPSAWTADAFGGEIRDGRLWGRGAADMKSGIAAFAAAAIDFVRGAPPDGAVILAVTGDEEGDALNGTAALLDWMAANGEAMSVCLVGEPTCQRTLGDMMKIGRRGSLTAHFSAAGVQGHSAYPHLAKNPVHAVAKLMDRLAGHRLDQGTSFFDPSSLAVTGIDTGNPASNVIPATCRAAVNVRFNDAHSAGSIRRWLEEETGKVVEMTGIAISVKVKVSGESFVTEPGELAGFVARAGRLKTGNVADRSNVIGPLINDRQAARVRHQLEDAVSKGARFALGGHVDGRFVEPTIVTHVTPDMEIWRNETFGPVAAVVPFRTDAEAILMSNDTEYGLSSGIITDDEHRAMDIAQQLETGMCHVNCATVNDEAHAPFGGTKASGLGRYGGRWSLESFSETRWITLDRGQKPFPPVF